MASVPLHLICHLTGFAIAPADPVELAAKALTLVARRLCARIASMESTTKRVLCLPLRDQLVRIGMIPRLHRSRHQSRRGNR